MSRICPLMSGSKANCTYISCESGSFLVDIGSSYKQFLSAFCAVGGSLEAVKGILITHEHSDHVGGLKMFLKNNQIPLIASAKTLDSLVDKDLIPKSCNIIKANDEPLMLGDVLISRFPTSHDCEGSSGYSFTVKNGDKVSVCTDTGILTDEAKENLLGSKAVLIESNHDITMLKNGPYHAALKARILSDKGHLSNTSCSAFLPELLKSGTNRIILGHISQNNNTPLLALSTAKQSLSLIGAEEGKDYLISAAKPQGNEVSVF